MGKLPADVKLIPGHGPISTVDDLKRYHQMLLTTTAYVRKKMTAKKSLAQIKKEGLPEEWKSWGTGFISTDLWIEIIYKSYSTGQPKISRTNHGH
jgi:hypothetical protein